jgi:membrane fusion protein (multidrug efflux system)
MSLEEPKPNAAAKIAEHSDASVPAIAAKSGPSAAIAAASTPLPGTAAPPRRRRAPLFFLLLVLLAAGGGTLLYRARLGKEATDDAQVEGRVVSVAARVPGQVTRVLVRDNQLVQAGDVLIELDARELEARLAAARADLASMRAQLAAAQAQLDLTERNITANLKQARGSLRQAASGTLSASANVKQSKADVIAARSRLQLAKQELDRSRKLSENGAASPAELEARQASFDQAQASVEQAEARLLNATANTTGSQAAISVAQGRMVAAETGPQQVAAARAAVDLAQARVDQAGAALRLAELNVSYTKITAPIRGQVSRRNVELGQLVSPERALLALVPTDDIWVVANYKEDQVAAMRAGQRAEVQIDAYPHRTFVARIESIAGATGARFSLLPPDNASGNFVKVAQRIPVLIRLDALPEVPLRPGMSANITVFTE